MKAKKKEKKEEKKGRGSKISEYEPKDLYIKRLRNNEPAENKAIFNHTIRDRL